MSCEIKQKLLLMSVILIFIYGSLFIITLNMNMKGLLIRIMKFKWDLGLVDIEFELDWRAISAIALSITLITICR